MAGAPSCNRSVARLDAQSEGGRRDRRPLGHWRRLQVAITAGDSQAGAARPHHELITLTPAIAIVNAEYIAFTYPQVMEKKVYTVLYWLFRLVSTGPDSRQSEDAEDSDQCLSGGH